MEPPLAHRPGSRGLDHCSATWLSTKPLDGPSRDRSADIILAGAFPPSARTSGHGPTFPHCRRVGGGSLRVGKIGGRADWHGRGHQTLSGVVASALHRSSSMASRRHWPDLDRRVDGGNTDLAGTEYLC